MTSIAIASARVYVGTTLPKALILYDFHNLSSSEAMGIHTMNAERNHWPNTFVPRVVPYFVRHLMIQHKPDILPSITRTSDGSVTPELHSRSGGSLYIVSSLPVPNAVLFNYGPMLSPKDAAISHSRE
jgi:hypothetical protein